MRANMQNIHVPLLLRLHSSITKSKTYHPSKLYYFVGTTLKHACAGAGADLSSKNIVYHEKVSASHKLF